MLFDTTVRRELARSFGATLVVILTIVLTMFLIRSIGQAASGAVAPQDVVLLLGYVSLGHLPTMLALSLFVAVVLTLGRMYRDSEMVIWFASGVGLARFVRPVLRTAWPVLLVVALLLLFVWLLPQGIGVPIRHDDHTPWLRDGLLLLPLLLMFFPPPQLDRHTGVVDLLYTLLFVLIIGVLALGSFAAMHLTRTDYAHAVMISLGTLLFSLLIIAWLWQPRGEATGLRNLFSRYVLSLGLPLEEWLKQLSEAAEREPDPELFLRAAMAGFTHLPWSTGVTWSTEQVDGELGERSAHSIAFAHEGVEVRFYTDTPVNPAFALHLRLLTEIIGYFHAAKTRERAMRTNAYTQAIYETGSRLTHDVKNLLQSLKTLCSAAEHSQPEQAVSLQNLMQRQLPQIAKRLEITLDKLKSPERAADRREILAREWWRNLKNRYARDILSFQIDDAETMLWIPQELFDSVADNLIQNALRKRVGQSDLDIRVELRTLPVPSLIVCDSGAAAPEEAAEKLFHAPVSTHDGLGIGLYQAAKQARGLGYDLELSRNLDGEVCFTLWQAVLEG